MSYLDVGKQSEPYDLFVFAINAEQTREKYVTRMKKFLETICIDREEIDYSKEVESIYRQSEN